MNKELFLNTYTDRISTKFDISKDFAFEILCLSAFLDISFDEAYNSASTLVNKNGSHDAGFDGIYIDQNEKIVHIFQIKNSLTLKDNELNKFLADYENIFVRNNPVDIRLNKVLESKIEQYLNLIKSGELFEIQLYFIFNGIKENSTSSQNGTISQRFESANNNLKILDSNDIFSQIESLINLSKNRKENIFTFEAEKSNISLRSDPQSLLSFSLLNVKAVNFRFKAISLCKLIDKEIELNGRKDTLFSENIRGYLGSNKTNLSIKNTLIGEKAEYFPFLNNGITIIASSVRFPTQMAMGYYNIVATNPVIVNGLQTTNVIYDIYKKDSSKLEGVFVMIRLYETVEPELITLITDATNTQSPISFRDKLSTKKFNDFTKEIFESKGIGYLTKRGETFANTLSKDMKETVTNETVLKFWYSTFFEKPTVARGNKSKVMEYCFNATENINHPLHKLFKADKNSPIYLQLFIAYKIYHFVVTKRQKYIKEDIEDFVFYADEIISYGIYRLLKKDNKIETYEEELEKNYNEVFEALKNVVDKEKEKSIQKGSTYSQNDYFKSERLVEDLNEELELSESSTKFEDLIKGI